MRVIYSEKDQFEPWKWTLITVYEEYCEWLYIDRKKIALITDIGMRRSFFFRPAASISIIFTGSYVFLAFLVAVVEVVSNLEVLTSIFQLKSLKFVDKAFEKNNL